MTYSILLHDKQRQEIGAAVASCYPGVGAVCLHGEFRSGLVITQSMANPWLGRQTLHRMQNGDTPKAALKAGLDVDPNRSVRQTHAMNLKGETWGETGQNCLGYAGALVAPGISIAGNMLAGSEVLSAMMIAALKDTRRPIAERLIAALEAGERAGGDKRGRQAAALRIHRHWTSHPIDLRVDDHEAPVTELRRIHSKLISDETLDAFDGTIPDEGGARPRHPLISL